MNDTIITMQSLEPLSLIFATIYHIALNYEQQQQQQQQ